MPYSQASSSSYPCLFPKSFRMTTASVLRTKLVVVGDWAVGKTAVVQQFLNSGTAFPKNYSMTLGGEVTVVRNISCCKCSNSLIRCQASWSIYQTHPMLLSFWSWTALAVGYFSLSQSSTSRLERLSIPGFSVICLYVSVCIFSELKYRHLLRWYVISTVFNFSILDQQVYTDLVSRAWTGASLVLAVFDCTRWVADCPAMYWYVE